MSAVAGISGFRRNAAAAVARDGVLTAVCEQGRLTRVRDVGIESGGFPEQALHVALEVSGTRREDLEGVVTAEDGVELSGCPGRRRIDHHLAHAAAAFLTSTVDEALVFVCDTHVGREVSAWRASGDGLEEVPLAWRGPAFATIYSRLTTLLGLQPGRDEYRVEALARLGRTAGDPVAEGLIRRSDTGLEIDSRFEEVVANAVGSGVSRAASIAGAVQQKLGRLLLEQLNELHSRTGLAALCVGGGLFFNTYFNTLIRQSSSFADLFVPVNPGNAGVAAGCALVSDPSPGRVRRRPRAASPFLGPAFTNEEAKHILDNCKLSYDFLDDGAIVERTVQALERGELVGWFRGRLEWGTRALGNRSIFANPRAPYVLENLNRFLKRREAHRAYGLSVRQEDVGRFFVGPPTSPFMEYEYGLRDPESFSSIVPQGIDRVRVQTVGAEPPLVRELLARFGEASGVPVLVNTSFNGFHEPIVGSPRDAVRVFYGTGLDMLVVENFVLRK